MDHATSTRTFGATLGSLLTDLIRRQFYDFIRQNESDITSDTLVAEWDKFRQVLNENRANGVFLEILYYYQRNVHLAELQDQGEMVSEIFPVTETPRGSYDFVELRRKGGLNLNRVVQVKARPRKSTSQLQDKARVLDKNFGLRLALAVPKPGIGSKYPMKAGDWKTTWIKPKGGGMKVNRKRN